MIRRVPSIVRLHAVPVPHTNQATYVLDPAGNRWVAKREADMGTESLLAEAISWLLGRAIGAPVPDAAFCDDPAERAWLSAVVPNVSHWSAPIADRVANPDALGAVLALDLLVLNEARHARNLLVQALADGSVLAWAIDADEALVGHPADYARRLDTLPSVRNHARGLPIDRLVHGAQQAAAAAGDLEGDEVEALAHEACAVAGEPEAREFGALVVRRAGALMSLVPQYLQELRRLR